MIPRKLITIKDMDNVKSHFLNDIKGADRRLRFGYEAKDEAVTDYLKNSTSDYGISNMWFIVDIGGKVIATCHIALSSGSKPTAELGFTVAEEYRNNKIGQDLFDRAINWVAMKGVKNVYMQCLSENKAMQHIAKKAGMAVITIGPGEKEANLTIKKNQLHAGFIDISMENMAICDAIVRNNYNYLNLLKMFS